MIRSMYLVLLLATCDTKTGAGSVDSGSTSDDEMTGDQFAEEFTLEFCTWLMYCHGDEYEKSHGLLTVEDCEAFGTPYDYLWSDECYGFDEEAAADCLGGLINAHDCSGGYPILDACDVVCS